MVDPPVHAQLSTLVPRRLDNVRVGNVLDGRFDVAVRQFGERQVVERVLGGRRRSVGRDLRRRNRFDLFFESTEAIERGRAISDRASTD